MNATVTVAPKERIVASFDIGIKNMAYCIFSATDSAIKEIIDWGIISMLEPPPPAQKCDAVILPKKGKKSKINTSTETTFEKCNNSAFYCCISGEKKCYCKKHIDKTKVINTKELSSLKKGSMEKMREFATTKNIKIPETKEKITRPVLLEKITNEIKSQYFVPISQNSGEDTIDAKELDLITAARIMTRELDRVFVNTGIIQKLTDVFIENQISTIAARMKTIQGMLTQYFIMRGGSAPAIKYISAAIKLRGKIDKKSTYSERKKLSIEICEKTLTENTNEDVKRWLPFFKNYGAKRDDLADSLLQGIAAICN